MAQGSTPWNRDGFSFQDLEAPFSRQGSLVRALGVAAAQERQHASGAYGGGAISTWKYKGPAGVGKHRVSPPGQPDREVVIPGPSTAFRPGQHVMVGQDRNGAVVLSTPPSGLAGSSGFSVDAPPAGLVESFKLTEASTAGDLLPESTDNPITLLGYGLKPDDVFTAVVYDPVTLTFVPDVLVTLHSPSFVDETEMSVLADLAPGAPENYRVKVLCRRS